MPNRRRRERSWKNSGQGASTCLLTSKRPMQCRKDCRSWLPLLRADIIVARSSLQFIFVFLTICFMCSSREMDSVMMIFFLSMYKRIFHSVSPSPCFFDFTLRHWPFGAYSLDKPGPQTGHASRLNQRHLPNWYLWRRGSPEVPQIFESCGSRSDSASTLPKERVTLMRLELIGPLGIVSSCLFASIYLLICLLSGDLVVRDKHISSADPGASC